MPGSATPRTAVPREQVWPLAEVVTRLRRALRASVRSDFAWERLPMAQIELMQRLAEEPRLRVKDLAVRHRLATNTVSQLVQSMVTAGLVDRQVDPHDRRAVVLTLTDSGREVLHRWLAANEDRLQAAMERLSERDRTAVLGVVPALTRLVDELETADRTRSAARR